MAGEGSEAPGPGTQVAPQPGTPADPLLQSSQQLVGLRAVLGLAHLLPAQADDVAKGLGRIGMLLGGAERGLRPQPSCWALGGLVSEHPPRPLGQGRRVSWTHRHSAGWGGGEEVSTDTGEEKEGIKEGFLKRGPSKHPVGDSPGGP